MREVADAAGVSLATASHAMRNETNASRATCKRVQSIARQLGYRPDPIMAAMSSRKARHASSLQMAAMLITSSPPSSSPVLSRYQAGLQTRFAELGYAFSVVNVTSEQELHRTAHAAYHMGVRAVVFGSFHHFEWIRKVDWSKFSVVLLDCWYQQPFVHTVRMDVASSYIALLERALARTGLRIGLIHHSHPTPQIHDDCLREALALHAFSRHPDRFASLLRLNFRDEFSAASKRAARWFRKEKPDLVIGFELGLHLLVAAGLPREFAFWNHSLREEGAVPGIVEPLADIACRAAEWIDSMVRHGERGMPDAPAVVSIPGRWWPGQESAARA